MTVLTEAEKQQLESSGFGVTGQFGGVARQTYYTPDGRVIKAIPIINNYVLKDKNGKTTGGGVRDANLDKGWTLQKPTILKLFCATCDRWHDTKVQVAACKASRDRMIALAGKTAKKEQKAKDVALEDKVARLETLVAKLTGGQSGSLLQFDDKRTSKRVVGAGTAKAGI
jgi:hypothetical protein